MLTPNKHQAGVVPDKQDVIHFVIAPEIGQFDQLGQTIEERLAAYKNAIRKPYNSLSKAPGLRPST